MVYGEIFYSGRREKMAKMTCYSGHLNNLTFAALDFDLDLLLGNSPGK